MALGKASSLVKCSMLKVQIWKSLKSIIKYVPPRPPFVSRASHWRFLKIRCRFFFFSFSTIYNNNFNAGEKKMLSIFFFLCHVAYSQLKTRSRLYFWIHKDFDARFPFWTRSLYSYSFQQISCFKLCLWAPFSEKSMITKWNNFFASLIMLLFYQQYKLI